MKDSAQRWDLLPARDQLYSFGEKMKTPYFVSYATDLRGVLNPANWAILQISDEMSEEALTAFVREKICQAWHRQPENVNIFAVKPFIPVKDEKWFHGKKYGYYVTYYHKVDDGYAPAQAGIFLTMQIDSQPTLQIVESTLRFAHSAVNPKVVDFTFFAEGIQPPPSICFPQSE